MTIRVLNKHVAFYTIEQYNMKINQKSIQLWLSKKRSVLSIKGKTYWRSELRGRIQKKARASGGANR